MIIDIDYIHDEIHLKTS